MRTALVQRTDYDKHGLLRTHNSEEVINLPEYINQLKQKEYIDGAMEIIETENKIIAYQNKLKIIYTFYSNNP